MSKAALSADTIVRRSENVLSSELGADVVMMDIDNGCYYGLQDVAARIWSLVETPASVGSICGQLMSEYDITADRCEEEVLTFVRQLVDQGMVQIVT